MANKSNEQIQYKKAVLFTHTKDEEATKDYFYEVHGFLSNYGHQMSPFIAPKWNDKGREYRESYHLHGATVEVTAIDRNRAPKRGHPKHWVTLGLASDKPLDDVVKYITDSFPDLEHPKKSN